jgi:two-component system OmpR family sensor kinase
LGRIDGDQTVMDRFDAVRLDDLVVPLESDALGVSVRTPGPVWVTGDKALLRHMVLNLVGNARRHGVSNLDELPAIDVELAIVTSPDSTDVVMTVADDGPGFPPELLATAFDRFVTGDGGTGLGLWIVRWIAELHGATVDVSNRPDGGALSTVRFTGAGSGLSNSLADRGSDY